ncbi:OLC1v1030022C1 [Oldenlandia corymbosa var. corymbosa]|uniref:OLC1v1030022C1 n=1 Tax=Oldenlandia corymbosa var. corymbosa TaxID=529605 RepID=A0AAV1CH42_OLDCO|nr:OLC1v1030022C1 [Oldenlandia corymbosa var. corymbosa]
MSGVLPDATIDANERVDPKGHPPDGLDCNLPPLQKANPPLLTDYQSLKHSRVRDSYVVYETSDQGFADQSKSDAPSPRRCFRDMLNLNQPHVEMNSDDGEGGDLDNEVTVDFDRPVPDVKIRDSLYASMVQSWKNIVVVKVMGITLTPQLLYSKLTALWPFMQGCHMIDLENGFFQIRFKQMMMQSKYWWEALGYGHVVAGCPDRPSKGEGSSGDGSPGKNGKDGNGKNSNVVVDTIGNANERHHEMVEEERLYGPWLLAKTASRPSSWRNKSVAYANQKKKGTDPPSGSRFNTLSSLHKVEEGNNSESLAIGMRGSTQFQFVSNSRGNKNGGAREARRAGKVVKGDEWRTVEEARSGNKKENTNHNTGVASQGNESARAAFHEGDKNGSGSKKYGKPVETRRGSLRGNKGVDGGDIDAGVNSVSNKTVVVHATTGLDPLKHQVVHVLESPGRHDNNASGPDPVNIDGDDDMTIEINPPADVVPMPDYSALGGLNDDDAMIEESSEMDSLVPGFARSFQIEAVGFSGGIWLLWKERVVVRVIRCHKQFLHVAVTVDNVAFLLTVVYASPNPRVRRELWRGLEGLVATIDEPWVFGGDFNCLLQYSKKQGSSRRSINISDEFAQLIFNYELQELRTDGHPFTWVCNNSGLTEKLDRFVGNLKWANLFSESLVCLLPRMQSDHFPLLLRCRRNNGVQQRTKPFRFLASWLLHEGFHGLVENAWEASNGYEDAARTENLWMKLVNVQSCSSFFSMSLEDWLCTNLDGGLMMDRDNWQVVFGITVWQAWQWRNRTVFNSTNASLNQKLSEVDSFVEGVASTVCCERKLGFMGRTKEHCWLRWLFPPENWLKLNTDGFFNPYTGMASSGGLLRDHMGRWCGGFVMNIGFASITGAKLWGLFQGLQQNWTLGFRQIIAEVDIASVVKMVEGTKEIVEVHKSLVLAIRELMRRDWNIVLDHVHQERNFAADSLASLAMSCPGGFSWLEEPPICVKTWLQHDIVGISYNFM